MVPHDGHSRVREREGFARAKGNLVKLRISRQGGHCGTTLATPQGMGASGMLLNQPVDRLNEAVHECLERCYRSADRLECLRLFVARLRADGWSAEDVNYIQTVVRHLLTAVVRGN